MAEAGDVSYTRTTGNRNMAEAGDVSYTRTTDNRNMRLGTLVIQGQLITGT